MIFNSLPARRPSVDELAADTCRVNHAARKSTAPDACVVVLCKAARIKSHRLRPALALFVREGGFPFPRHTAPEPACATHILTSIACSTPAPERATLLVHTRALDRCA